MVRLRSPQAPLQETELQSVGHPEIRAHQRWATRPDEMCFRFSNRKNPFLFLDTFIKPLSSPHIEYKDLTTKVQDAA
ncbi:MAG: hypothetical protein ACHQLQ_09360 [Candidatus Acidiferrales bacterium]